MKKPLSLITAIILGFLFSETFYKFSFITPACLMLMLFFPCLKTKFVKVEKWIIPILFTCIYPFILGILAYFAVHQFTNNIDILVATLLVCITPAGMSSAIIIDILGGNVAFTLISTIISSLSSVILLPTVLEWFFSAELNATQMLIKLLIITLLPFILSRILIKLKMAEKLLKFSSMSFYAWVIGVFVNTALVTHFTKLNVKNLEFWIPVMIIISAAVLLSYIIVGYFTNKVSDLGKEIAQVFGQKNTMISIWIATEFFNPVVALAPIMYLVLQNIYNAIKIYAFEHKKRIKI